MIIRLLSDASGPDRYPRSVNVSTLEYFLQQEMNKIKKLKKYCKNNKPEKIFKHYKDGGEYD